MIAVELELSQAHTIFYHVLHVVVHPGHHETDRLVKRGTHEVELDRQFLDAFSIEFLKVLLASIRIRQSFFETSGIRMIVHDTIPFLENRRISVENLHLNGKTKHVQVDVSGRKSPEKNLSKINVHLTSPSFTRYLLTSLFADFMDDPARFTISSISSLDIVGLLSTIFLLYVS